LLCRALFVITVVLLSISSLYSVASQIWPPNGVGTLVGYKNGITPQSFLDRVEGFEGATGENDIAPTPAPTPAPIQEPVPTANNDGGPLLP